MEYAAGVDFGGSSAKIGLIARDGSVLARENVSIDSRAGFDEVLGPVSLRLSALVSGRPRTDKLVVAGIGMPGFIDTRGGIVVGGAENIPCFRDRSPQDYLERALGVPAFSENDATAAAAGELLFGAGRKFASFLLITLGTAIGGGLVLGGRVTGAPAVSRGKWGTCASWRTDFSATVEPGAASSSTPRGPPSFARTWRRCENAEATYQQQPRRRQQPRQQRQRPQWPRRQRRP